MARKYKFSWDLLGNLEEGRPNLGPYTRVEIYRLMQFAFRDVLEAEYGSEVADEVFYKAGKLAGEEFYTHCLKEATTFNELVRTLQESLKEMSIGIFRIEQASSDNSKLIFTISEDLDCAGLPELDYEICTYDEGFVAGILEKFAGVEFDVKEVDCWCTGDRTCRFRAAVKS